ncbi:MAG: PDZ domain-containing protein [Xanthomonadales bacterium]|nr:PDZ domain-containing protein [Xanthomonadales bacterium]
MPAAESPAVPVEEPAPVLDVPVHHQVRFTSPNMQVFTVASEFPSPGDLLELRMPVWTPGSYVVREYAQHIVTLRAETLDGQPLELRTLGKNRWEVDAAGVDSVRVVYDLFAGELDTQTNWISPELAVLNGAATFLYNDQTRNLVQTVRVETAPLPGRAWSAMRELAPSVYQADDYDQLVDSPIVVTPNLPRRFEVDGAGYRLLHVGDDRFWRDVDVIGDLSKLVDKHQAFWEADPLVGDFWFLNVLLEREGGLEHDQSTLMIVPRGMARDRESYVDWLALASHEFFHVWNVRHMRPEGLAEYDYDREQYSTQLWLAEGLTSYYDGLLLSRARLVSAPEYFRLLAKEIHALEQQPGRAVRSLEDASRDAWIRHYRPGPNTPNSTVSYYRKGAVLGFVLDVKMRDASAGRVDLDDAMREMFDRYSDTPYPPGALSEVVRELAGDAVGNWLDEQTSGTAELDVDEALAWFGLVLDRDPEATAAEAEDRLPAAGLGVTWEDQAPGKQVELRVKNVPSDSAAAAAGILAGDEILAIGGERVTPDSLETVMKWLHPGEPAVVLLARKGQVRSVEITLQGATPEAYEILAEAEITRRELTRMEDWLGQPIEVAP